MHKIKDLGQKAFEDMVALDQKFLNYYWNDSQWSSFFESYPDDALVQLHYDDDSLVSFALYLGNELDNSLHLLKVVTHPLKRGEGLATSFLKKAISHLGTGGKIYLEVAVQNNLAISVYEKVGFNVTRHMKRFYSDGSDALEMLLEIE